MLATFTIYGIKLFGISFGFSPSNPDGCAPIGLKYLSIAILHVLSDLYKSLSIPSIINFVVPYGLVVDLANGHIKAIEKILKENICDAYNLGTGKGYSVLELVNAFSKVNNIDVKYKITDRRPGDIDACYADTSYALKELNFKTTKTIEEMCKDSYNFILKNK